MTNIPTLEDNLAGIFLSPEGWWFPGGARGRHQKMLAHENDVLPAIKRLPRGRRRTAVQAGANVGLFPITLAKHFQKVVTFEPEKANWECFQRNLDAHPKLATRIQAFRLALGSAPGVGELLYNRNNPAGHKFKYAGKPNLEVHGKYEAVEGFGVAAIDELALEDVDLLCLDIEGAEWPAMQGGEATIKRCRPIILLEEREHTRVHGYELEDMHRWLRGLGYRHRGKVAKDQLWVPK